MSITKRNRRHIICEVHIRLKRTRLLCSFIILIRKNTVKMSNEQEWLAQQARICFKNGEIAEALQFYSSLIHPNLDELDEIQKHPDYNNYQEAIYLNQKYETRDIKSSILEQTMTLMQAYDSNSEVWKLGVNAYKLNNIIYAESSVGRTEKIKQLTHDYLQNKLDDLNYLMAIGNLIAENHN